jgi:hypothetical protein
MSKSWKGFEQQRDELIRLGNLARDLDKDLEDGDVRGDNQVYQGALYRLGVFRSRGSRCRHREAQRGVCVYPQDLQRPRLQDLVKRDEPQVEDK